MSGTLLLTTELDGSSVSTPAVILVEWPDKVRLELQDPVGGMLALLVLNGDRFWLYQSERPELLTGPVKKLPFGMIPKVSAEELVRLLLARPYPDRMRQGKIGSGQSVFRDQRLRETVRWNEDDSEPSEWRQAASAANNVVNAIYEDYAFQSGLHYPTKIRLETTGPDGKEKHILLVWKDWEANVPKEKKLFQIPQQQTFGRKIKALP